MFLNQKGKALKYNGYGACPDTGPRKDAYPIDKTASGTDCNFVDLYSQKPRRGEK